MNWMGPNTVAGSPGERRFYMNVSQMVAWTTGKGEHMDSSESTGGLAVACGFSLEQL